MAERNDELEAFKQGLWVYLLDHCEIEKSGVMFVKFHSAGRNEFERKITSRAKGYFRNDPIVKGALAETKHHIWIDEKKLKQQRYYISRDERLAALEIVKRRNEWRALSPAQKLKSYVREFWFRYLLRTHGRM